MLGHGSLIESYADDDHTPNVSHGGAPAAASEQSAAAVTTKPAASASSVKSKAVSSGTPQSVNKQILGSRAVGKANADSNAEGYLDLTYNGMRRCPAAGCANEQVQIIRGVGKCHCGHTTRVHRRKPAPETTTVVFADTDGDGIVDTAAADVDGDGSIDVVGKDFDEDGLLDALWFKGGAGMKGGKRLNTKAGGVRTHNGKKPVIVKGGAAASADESSGSGSIASSVKDQWGSRIQAASMATGAVDVRLSKLPGEGMYRFQPV